MTARPPDAPAEPRWGLGDAALGWFASVVGAQLALAVAITVTGSEDRSLALIAASLLGSYAGFLAIVLLAVHTKGSGSLVADFGLRFRRVDLLLGPLAGLFATFVLVPVVSLPVQRLFPEIDLSAEARSLFEVVDGLGVGVLALLVAGATPVVEELFFRGLLLRALQRRVGPGWAVALSSVLFGLAHLQGPQLPALVALGVLLGLLVVRTGRLGGAIVAHAVFNGLTVAYFVLFD